MLGFLKHFFKLQFLLIAVAVIAGIYYPQILEWMKAAFKAGQGQQTDEPIALHFESGKEDDMLFSREQLATYNGENGAPLYLALLGSIYDVSKGVKHYGPGCAYNFFVGRDASNAFITGKFEDFDEATADDVITLKPSELLSLANWKGFYDKDYTYKGKLIGRFYDSEGKPTKYYFKYLSLLEQAQDAKVATEELRKQYPDCNIEWSAETGTRVWCTTTSGGEQRDWIGHPRKLFVAGSDSFRCACIQEEELDTTAIMLKSYDNCEHLSHECFYVVN